MMWLERVLRRNAQEVRGYYGCKRLEYAVFCGTKWARFSNLRTAARCAAKYWRNGVYVRAMPISNDTWDAPTFRVCSRPIYGALASIDD